MRLVIERSGGFDIIESGDVERIEVENHGVRIYMTDGTDTFAERGSHAESVATAAAIAAKCGTLVEALAEAPEVDGEEDAIDDDVIGAAMAGLVRKNSKPWKPANEWVEGEPPRDGRWYVVWSEAVGGFSLARWWSVPGCWADPHGTDYATCDIEAHLPTPIPER